MVGIIMSKNKNKKKERIEKLRSVLDNSKSDNLNPDDEKHLKALSKRLKKTSEKNSPNVKITYKIGEEKKEDPLKPHVTVHPRKIKKDVVKIELPPPEKKEIKVEEKKQLPEDDIFEVEKVEIKEPEFVAVKPKETTKKTKTKKVEKELSEWEEVETKKPEPVKKEKVEQWEPVDVSEQVIEKEREKNKDDIEKVDDEKEDDVQAFTEVQELEKKEEVDNQIKIDIFEDISCIDDKIAITLYDNGFNCLLSINLASIEDINYLTGLSKRKVKKIKEEVDKKLKSIPKEDQIVEVTAIEAETKPVEEPNEVKEESIDFIDVQETEIKKRDKEERKLEKERQKEQKKKEKLEKIEAKKLLKEQKKKDKLAEKEKKEKEKQEKIEAKNLLKEKKLQEAKDKKELKENEKQEKLEAKKLLKEQKMQEAQAEKERKEREKELKKQEENAKAESNPDVEAFTEVEEIDIKEEAKPIEEFEEIELEQQDVSGKRIKKKIEEEIHEENEIEPVPFIEVEEDKKDKPKLFSKIKKVKIKSKKPKKEEEFDTEELEKDEDFDNQIKIDIFEDISCIDDKVAINLYDHGYNSLESIDSASIDDIKSLTNISKRKAKKIKEEVGEKLKSMAVENNDKETHETKDDFIEERIREEDIPSIEEKPTKVEPIKIDETAELELDEEELVEEEISLDDVKIDAFNEIESIDDETALILYNNGYTTMDDLIKANIDDLKKIKGLKKRTVKKFMKEINEKNIESFKAKPIDVEETANALITKEQLKDEDEVIEEEEMELTTSTVELESESTEWVPLEPVESEESVPIKNEKIDDKTKINTFKDIQNIDDVTAIILYDAGYKSLESLNKASVNDLSKVKGIKKKQAKNIKKEIESLFSEAFIEDGKKGFDLDVDFGDEESVNEDEMIAIDKQILNHDEPRDDRYLVFKDIDCINKKTAKLLVNNGIDSVEDLRDKTIKQLVAIKGIKRKLAKQIKKELEGPVENKAKKSKKKAQPDSQFYLSENNNEIANPDTMQALNENNGGFTYKDFTLYEKEIKTKSNKKRIVRFFSKEKPEKAKPITLPDGYEVINNTNGVPYLKKKK
jgi:hypothetical protein